MDKKIAFKKQQFINEKKDKYKSIFEDGFVRMIMNEDFNSPDINSIISFLENRKLLSKNYRAKPTKILDENSDVELNSIVEFLNSKTIFILFSYVFDNRELISGYLEITKSSFQNNFYKLNIQSAFLLSENLTKFVYFSVSNNSRKVYLYLGEIEQEKFVKILN